MASKDETKNVTPESGAPGTADPGQPSAGSGNIVPPVDNANANFKVDDQIQIKIGVQVFKGTIVKIDAKGEMPYVLLLTDHNDKTGKQFARMAKAEQLEKVK